MKTLKSNSASSEKSCKLDEFDLYLRKQCLKTTFNGIELDSCNWYRNILGYSKH
ncbi:hypothetical protein IJG72_01040 [bacterium]|nr:hypothetical protein [bacterium]